jgi:hypothetical protein
MHLEVAKGLTPVIHSLEEQADGVSKGIWPETLQRSLLRRFVNTHFKGNDEMYWAFGLWASDTY